MPSPCLRQCGHAPGAQVSARNNHRFIIAVTNGGGSQSHRRLCLGCPIIWEVTRAGRDSKKSVLPVRFQPAGLKSDSSFLGFSSNLLVAVPGESQLVTTLTPEVGRPQSDGCRAVKSPASRGPRTQATQSERPLVWKPSLGRTCPPGAGLSTQRSLQMRPSSSLISCSFLCQRMSSNLNLYCPC